MTLEEALSDKEIKEECIAVVLLKYGSKMRETLADDAWQEVCVSELARRVPPKFKSRELARNYLSRATMHRAQNLSRRKLENVAESENEFLGDDSNVSLILDDRPNAEEAWCGRMEEEEEAQRLATLVANVQSTLASLPPVGEATMRLLLDTPKGKWEKAIMREFDMDAKQAKSRLDFVRKQYWPRFAALRPVPVAPAPPSEKSSTGSSQIAA